MCVYLGVLCYSLVDVCICWCVCVYVCDSCSRLLHMWYIWLVGLVPWQTMCFACAVVVVAGVVAVVVFKGAFLGDCC